MRTRKVSRIDIIGQNGGTGEHYAPPTIPPEDWTWEEEEAFREIEKRQEENNQEEE